MRWVLLVLPTFGCTLATPLAEAPRSVTVEPSTPTYGVPGESIEYRCKLRGLTVATVQVAVGQLGWVDGRQAIIIRSHGYSDGLLSTITDFTWELTTTLAPDTGYPIRDSEQARLVFNGHEERTDRQRDWTDSDHLHDLHSAAGVLRGWAAEPGRHVSFEVVIDEAQIAIELWQAGREYLPAAHAPAVRYEGMARGKYHFAIWVSDDKARVPLLVRTDTKWGAVTVELVDYQAPPD